MVASKLTLGLVRDEQSAIDHRFENSEREIEARAWRYNAGSIYERAEAFRLLARSGVETRVSRSEVVKVAMKAYRNYAGAVGLGNEKIDTLAVQAMDDVRQEFGLKDEDARY
jgi:hypothetical protein